jgi:hypothetical protein
LVVILTCVIERIVLGVIGLSALEVVSSAATLEVVSAAASSSSSIVTAATSGQEVVGVSIAAVSTLFLFLSENRHNVSRVQLGCGCSVEALAGRFFLFP